MTKQMVRQNDERDDLPEEALCAHIEIDEQPKNGQ